MTDERQLQAILLPDVAFPDDDAAKAWFDANPGHADTMTRPYVDSRIEGGGTAKGYAQFPLGEIAPNDLDGEMRTLPGGALGLYFIRKAAPVAETPPASPASPEAPGGEPAPGVATATKGAESEVAKPSPTGAEKYYNTEPHSLSCLKQFISTCHGMHRGIENPDVAEVIKSAGRAAMACAAKCYGEKMSYTDYGDDTPNFGDAPAAASMAKGIAEVVPAFADEPQLPVGELKALSDRMDGMAKLLYRLTGKDA